MKFLLVLIIILAAPLLLNKIKVPHLLGLIIAGAVISLNGFNVLARDSSIVVTEQPDCFTLCSLQVLKSIWEISRKTNGKALLSGYLHLRYLLLWDIWEALYSEIFGINVYTFCQFIFISYLNRLPLGQ
ncbi:hypothetical protein [Chryseobacterium indoltheticum]|uniref:hypothetical protein n=1 Tax=Chryseobacterium indoltheticum TaxID=254 RepID=UPI003F491957